MSEIEGYYAWNVPCSSMLVVLKMMRRFVKSSPEESDFYYYVGASMKCEGSMETGYSFFNVKGDDIFVACENFMSDIDRSFELAMNIMDRCNGEFDGYADGIDSWKYPSNSSDQMTRMFGILPHYLTLDSFKLLYNRRTQYNGKASYYACLVNDKGNIIFMSDPSSNKDDAMNSMKLSAMGAGAMLDKLKSMVWNVMIDSNHPDYEILSKDNGRLVLKRMVE